MIRSMKLAIFILILILGVLIVGCSKDSPAEVETPSQDEEISQVFSIVDDFGREITLDKEPARIISLAPSITETLYALDLGEKIVGVSVFDNYPAEVLDVEKVEDLIGINYERIIELEPDLVIVYGDEANKEEKTRLEEYGVNYARFEPKSIEEVIESIKKIGELTGKVDEAKVLTDSMRSKMDEILDKIKGSQPRKVFYEVWHEPLMTAGPNSLIDELITLAGGDNVAKNAEGENIQFDLQKLIERNPEVYLTSNDFPEKTVESIRSRLKYENIDAIINGDVHILDSDIISRPGPRIIQALELVAKAIHPEMFK